MKIIISIIFAFSSKSFKSILTMLGLTFALITNASNDGIVASISVDSNLMQADDGVNVELTLSNQGNGSIRMLMWFTPQNRTLDEDIFVITRDGIPVEYIGRHYKRGPIDSSNIVIIAAGESISAKINLSESYDISQTGHYQIKYDVPVIDLYDNSTGLPTQPANSIAPAKVDRLVSSELGIWVDGQIDELYPTNITKTNNSFDLTQLAAGSGITYSGACTSNEKSLLSKAVSVAKDIASESSNYLSELSSASLRFKTWFGTGSHSTVDNNFRKISNAFQTKNLALDCSCNSRAFAYVYPNNPYKIYLCNAFWSARMNGTDSKSGTMVHEMSHFNILAGTRDLQYGQSGAKSLARSNPDKAIRNADNHEYFAENSPFQE